MLFNLLFSRNFFSIVRFQLHDSWHGQWLTFFSFRRLACWSLALCCWIFRFFVALTRVPTNFNLRWGELPSNKINVSFVCDDWFSLSHKQDIKLIDFPRKIPSVVTVVRRPQLDAPGGSETHNFQYYTVTPQVISICKSPGINMVPPAACASQDR